MASPSKISPILRHALESFEHGVLHYLEGNELGRKFALLHIDHAVELILKEKVARIGKSIFRKDGKTISIHKAYESLMNVEIPEKPRLEDLHDFRNIVQHKGLTPDPQTTEFYVTEAYSFLKRFLLDELGITVESTLPRAYIRAMERTEADESQLMDEVNRRLRDAEKLFSAGTHEMAVISAFVALEIAVRHIIREQEPIPMINILRRLVDSGQMDKPTWQRFKEAAAIRNRVAHTGGGISKEEARSAINKLNGLIEEIIKLKP
jgi:uncharacterized protein YutE (UPF0331/DUF86 family)